MTGLAGKTPGSPPSRAERVGNRRAIDLDQVCSGHTFYSKLLAQERRERTPMAMNVKPIPTLDPRVNEIRELTARIVNKEILPNERILSAGWKASATPEERAKSRETADHIKDTVKKAGLWAPHLPPEYGGSGMKFMEHAYMNEVLAYTTGGGGPFCGGGPNSGNQTILLKYGTEEQRRKWLVPLTEGKLESGFSMTEPDSPGSDPRQLK